MGTKFIRMLVYFTLFWALDSMIALCALFLDHYPSSNLLYIVQCTQTCRSGVGHVMALILIDGHLPWWTILSLCSASPSFVNSDNLEKLWFQCRLYSIMLVCVHFAQFIREADSTWTGNSIRLAIASNAWLRPQSHCFITHALLDDGVV